MKRLSILSAAVVVVVLVFTSCLSAQQPAPKTETPKTETPKSPAPAAPKARTVDDYAKELKILTGATETGTVIQPESNAVRYPFVPLRKDGKVIAYGSWVSNIIYNHPEDLIVAVKPDGTLMNFKAIDANERHQNLQDENWKKRFFGMTKDRDFNTKADLATGSTYSTNTWFFEMKNILKTFDGYIKPKL